MHKWFTPVAAVLGLLLVAALGLWGYLSTPSPPLHPNIDDVPVVAYAAAPPAWAPAAARARQVVRSGLVEQNLPGLSVAVGIGGELVWAEGAGWANLERREPVTPDTRFRIGTASMALTSAAVGELLARQRLSLDDEVHDLVPAFPPQRWPVTLRQLMGHLSGVRNDGGDEGPLLSTACARPTDAFPHFAARPLLFEPGTAFQVSSYGWIAVSAAVEAVAREPFLHVMRKRLFEPLGMHDTTADGTKSMADHATSYFPRFSADPRYGVDVMRPIDLSCYAGASVFVSTASDLVRFGMAMQRGTLLTPATVALLQTSQRLASGQETGYGLGWDLESVMLAGQPTQVIGHDGDVLGGMVASLMTVPTRGVVVVVLSNASYAGTSGLATKIAVAFLN